MMTLELNMKQLVFDSLFLVQVQLKRYNEQTYSTSKNLGDDKIKYFFAKSWLLANHSINI